MKIFKDEKFDKVNFVDNENVFVGYDMRSKCCEIYGWYIDYKENENIPATTCKTIIGLNDYLFDIVYFKSMQGNIFQCNVSIAQIVIFKLTAEEKPDLYLHLFNCQNGYYSHGFEFKIDNEVLRAEEI